MVSNNKNDDSEFLVDNLLHKVEETNSETDVILEKDCVNKKWILKFGETFSKQLTEKKGPNLDLQSILVLLKRMILQVRILTF